MDSPPPIPPPPSPIDYETASDEQSTLPLWRELFDGTASVFVKLAVCVALIPLLVGVGLVASFIIAGIVPRGMRSYGPDDDIVGVVLTVCGFVYIAGVAWVWTRQRRRHKAIWKAMAFTALAVAVTFLLAALIASTLHRAGEILIIASIFLGIAAILLIWTHALRSYVRYRPPTHSPDGMLDVKCPTCGYRMVGLHEARCPECGTSYTLDDLLAQQSFIARTQPPPRRPVTMATASTGSGGAIGSN